MGFKYQECLELLQQIGCQTRDFTWSRRHLDKVCVENLDLNRFGRLVEYCVRHARELQKYYPSLVEFVRYTPEYQHFQPRPAEWLEHNVRVKLSIGTFTFRSEDREFVYGLAKEEKEVAEKVQA